MIIGAAIGGVFNWAANGAEFTWDGLGYFGIGAVAGAVGAGVGAGISSAMAGGSFGAGFAGSSTAMTASSSFVSGAAIGGGAGFSGGYTTGFGNALVGGENLGNAFGTGLKAGLIGGVSGGLIGGAVGGISAISDKRNFWSGKDQGSGRGLFAFNNSDNGATHYRTNKVGYELIDNIEREGKQWIDTYTDRVHYGNGDGPISNGALSRRDNYFMPGDKPMKMSLSRFKGRTNVNFSGHIPEGCSVQILHDGKVVQSFMAGSNFKSMVIPANIRNLSIRYLVPTNYAPSGTISPWRSVITGVKRLP